jgi:hypothetical protein
VNWKSRLSSATTELSLDSGAFRSFIIRNTHHCVAISIDTQLTTNFDLSKDIAVMDKKAESPASSPFQRVGSIDMGVDLTEEAWPRLSHVFHNRGGPSDQGFTTALQDGPLDRLPLNYLILHPVDLLVISRHGEPALQDRIFDMVIASGAERPTMILELWPIGAVIHTRGPMSKSSRELWSCTAGYTTRCGRVHAGETGVAVDQSKLVVLRLLPRHEQGLVWPKLLLNATRPMANYLRPMGIPQKAFISGPSPEWEPSAHMDPMPATPGKIIQTDRGRRRLLNNKLALGLGVPRMPCGSRLVCSVKPPAYIFWSI